LNNFTLVFATLDELLRYQRTYTVSMCFSTAWRLDRLCDISTGTSMRK